MIDVGTPLGVLIVEDSADDAELVLRLLRRAGYDPHFERVQTADAMSAALAREVWDVVVSDYSMPEFDAPRALNLLNESGHDIPFIVVSGAIGEDTAVATLQAGAQDFILKQHLSRLIPAVQRELRQAKHRLERRLAEQAKEQLRIERDALLERLKQENEDLVALTRITANAIGTLDLDEMLRVLLERVTEVMKADSAAILLVEGSELRVAARAGVVDMKDSPPVRRVGQGFTGSIASHMEAVYVDDASMDPLTAPLTRDRGIRSRLGVPLKHNGVLVGVMHVGWLSVRPRRDREVHLLETTAERCAAAIRNSRLHQETSRINAAFIESEANLRAAQQLAGLGSWTYELSGHLAWSAEMYRVYGVSPESFAPSVASLIDLIHADDRNAMEEWIRACAAGEKPGELEFRAIAPDGSERYLSVRGELECDADGKPIRLSGTALDITERKRTEDRLRKLSRVVEQAPLSIIITDLVGDIEYVNPKFCELTGYAKEDVKGRNPRILQSGATPKEVYRDLWATLAAGQVWRGELHNRKKNGETYVEQAVIAPVIDSDGRTTHYVALKEDVTRDKQVEREASESAQRFEQLVQHIDEVFWMTDKPTTQMPYVSPTYEAIWGRTCASLLASPNSWLDAVHPEDRERALQASRTDQATGAYDIQYRIVQPDGTVRWIHDRAFPVENQAGEVYRIVGVANDITASRQAHDALVESLHEKEALLKEVHHRVKNNLQVITSLLRLETGRNADPSTRGVLKDMQGRIQSMALLHETLYRSGTFASVDLGVYLRQLATQAFRALNGRPHSVELDLQLDSVKVEMDHAIPCGLLVNELISNCLKHGFPDGRAGSIRVDLRATEEGSGFRLSVADTGVGLPADFESKRSRSLGLQLASDLARQLGGRLEIEPGAVSGVSMAVTWAAANPGEEEQNRRSR